MKIEDYGLDMHCNMILEEYREMQPVFKKIMEVVKTSLLQKIKDNNLYITASEARIKTEKSLAGKLELKGYKYATLSDITDILGCRVITFYKEEVDKVAALVDHLFEIDWDNSVDKRKKTLDVFGYNSLHYICRIPKSLFYDPEMPQVNEYRFELQMRTCLEHAWATIEHDVGYKTGVKIPESIIRRFNQIAGMLELIDEQFGHIRTEVTEYSRKVFDFVSSGNFDDVELTPNTFRTFVELGHFDSLNQRIAAINNAEVQQMSLIPYVLPLQELGFKTLGDVYRMIENCSHGAYELARHELGITDIDIVGSNIGLQNLMCVKVLKDGLGEAGLKHLFDLIDGESDYNAQRASHVYSVAKEMLHAK